MAQNILNLPTEETIDTKLSAVVTALQGLQSGVYSVNGKNGTVILSASDVGALASTTTYVSSVNGSSGAITGLATTASLNTVSSNVTTIQGLIPTQATTTNQLADKAFVNSTVNSMAAFFRGSFSTKAALEAYTGEKTNNDYAYVVVDETHDNQGWRYIYVKPEGQTGYWSAQFKVNDTPFTQSQQNAINSGITSALVAQIGQGGTWGSITGNISSQTDLQNALDNKSTVTVSETGTATDEVNYIVIDGVEKKIAGGGAAIPVIRF